MPRLRVIVLDRIDTDTYRYALWADVPAARQGFFASASRVSEWKNATAADNTALQNGSVTEDVNHLQVPPGSNQAQIQTHLEARWNAFQTRITSVNPWVRYGTSWDGAAWTPGGVA